MFRMARRHRSGAPRHDPQELGVGVGLPDLSPRRQSIRMISVTLAIASLAMLVNMFIVGPLHHRSRQEQLRDEFREQLATGTAPLGAVDGGQRPIRQGTPVALLEIPSIGLSEVVVEGTGGGELFGGPGHRRDTPLPGQPGTSVIMGRSATFGAPFGSLARLEPGAEVRATTGQGTFDFLVIGRRRAGDPVPPPLQPTWARITLVTAAGSALTPTGAVEVDADLVGYSVGGVAPLITEAQLPVEERTMAVDTRTIWRLAFWLQGLIVLSVAFVWAWIRWGRAQAWICVVPTMVVAGLAATGEALKLLPNLY